VTHIDSAGSKRTLSLDDRSNASDYPRGCPNGRQHASSWAVGRVVIRSAITGSRRTRRTGRGCAGTDW